MLRADARYKSREYFGCMLGVNSCACFPPMRTQPFGQPGSNLTPTPDIKRSDQMAGSFNMAERAGFEPAIRLPAYTLSKRAPSATRTPLQMSNLAIISENHSPTPICKAYLTLVPVRSSSRRRHPRLQMHLELSRPPANTLSQLRTLSVHTGLFDSH